MQNSKYVSSWFVNKLPNGIYQLIFNTTEKWIQYHRYSATEYLFWIDGKEDVQEKGKKNEKRKIGKMKGGKQRDKRKKIRKEKGKARRKRTKNAI